jgi:hypothetical protein
MVCAEHMARMKCKFNVYKILVRKPEEYKGLNTGLWIILKAFLEK